MFTYCKRTACSIILLVIIKKYQYIHSACIRYNSKAMLLTKFSFFIHSYPTEGSESLNRLSTGQNVIFGYRRGKQSLMNDDKNSSKKYNAQVILFEI